jgi:hypothetical protein
LREASTDDLASNVLNRQLSMYERESSYSWLVGRNPTERREGLLRILRDADELFPVKAVWALIRDGDRSVELRELLTERIVKWGVGEQLQTLIVIRRAGEPKELLDVSRAILRDAVDRGGPPTEYESFDDAWVLPPADSAARLLAKSEEPEDVELLRHAVTVYSSSRELWMALARRNALDAPLTKLARSVMNNDSLRISIRVAAALALSRDDAETKKFAIKELREFLNEFAQSTIIKRIMWTMSLYPDKKRPTLSYAELKASEPDVMRYRRTFSLLDALLFLDEESARPLTFEHLPSVDPGIRLTMALIAAKRWPERFLESDREGFPNDIAGEYEMVLAAVVFYHPHLMDQVAAKSSAMDVNKWLDSIKKDGLEAVFGFGGEVLWGW